MLIRIQNDVYEIAKRIKDIEESYYIVYNTSKNKFEVHNSAQLGSSYCLTLPFDQLDERTLSYVCESMSKNIETILENIENDNRKNESAEKSRTLATTYELIEESIRR